jgi:hypothetical protein
MGNGGRKIRRGAAAKQSASACAVLLLAAICPGRPLSAQQPVEWPVNSMERPHPPVVDPGPERPPEPAPSDALVLFDGHDLSAWLKYDGSDPGWRVHDDELEVVGGSGSIMTRQRFGNIQLHLEWAAPMPPTGEGQERGNSGVFLMGKYEVQVLDCWQNVTYADGQAAATYGQTPPLVNACRPPGKWQSYDIIFHRPRFTVDGKVQRPARVTVLHNGVLVQDGVAFTGQTVHGKPAIYEPHADRLPLILQDHGNPVRYRNIWVRELRDE